MPAIRNNNHSSWYSHGSQNKQAASVPLLLTIISSIVIIDGDLPDPEHHRRHHHVVSMLARTRCLIDLPSHVQRHGQRHCHHPDDIIIELILFNRFAPTFT